MRGHIRKRGPDTWELAIYLGKDESGRKRYAWQTVHGSKRDAEQAAAKIVSGQLPAPRSAKRTVSEHLRKWLSDVAEQRVAPATFYRYRDIVEQALIPALGATQLARLRPDAIQRAFHNWLKAKLSPQTVVHYHRVLKQALAIAVRWGDLVRSPSDLIDPPRVERKPPAIMDEATTFELLDKLAGNRVQVAAMLAIATGMRRGEILALRWSDVEIDRGMLSITRSLEQAGKEVRFKDTKSRRGRRQIALPEFAVAALRRHEAKQNTIRLAHGNEFRDNDLIVCCQNGDPWKPNLLTPAWGQALASRTLPHIRFHDLRHAHASWLLRQGIHPKVVSERLGHSSIGITLDTYSHVMPGMQEDAARRLNDALSAPRLATDWQEPQKQAVSSLPGRRRKPVK